MAPKQTHSLYTIIPMDLFKWLKKTAADQQRPMTEIIINLVEKYKEKVEKRIDK